MSLHYTYFIIGGGMTAAAAVQGIREIDAEGSIGLISAEAHPPYARPPLSKQLWQGKPLESIWRGTEDCGVHMHLERSVQTLDPRRKQVIDNHETTYTFEKLLLATGGTPRRLPHAPDGVTYFRSLADYKRLCAQAARGGRFAIIGGGFIGSEIAAALAMNGQDVVMIFPESGIGGRAFPTELAHFLNDYYRERGVAVLPGERIGAIEQRNGQYRLETEGGGAIIADHVVAGLGIEPDVGLAERAGLAVENGILVDEHLQTSAPDIYAAGDVANFFNPTLNARLRVEHEDNANTMGRIAGRAMAGDAAAYHHLPFFYSDLFDLGYEAVGELDARLETVIDWQEPYQKGVIYYLRDQLVRGVLLWNVWDQVDAARNLIAAGPIATPAALAGRIQ